MSEMGQSLPNCDVRVTSVHPSISDMILQHHERRNGPKGDLRTSLIDSAIAGGCGLLRQEFDVTIEPVCWRGRPIGL
jgi:hypothetical protein